MTDAARILPFGPGDQDAEQRKRAAREKMRRHRARKRAGVVAVKVELTPETIRGLVRQGWTDERELAGAKDQRKVLADICSTVIECFGRDNLVKDGKRFTRDDVPALSYRVTLHGWPGLIAYAVGVSWRYVVEWPEDRDESGS